MRGVGRRQGLSPSVVGTSPSLGRRTGLLSGAGQAYLMQESGTSMSRPDSV